MKLIYQGQLHTGTTSLQRLEAFAKLPGAEFILELTFRKVDNPAIGDSLAKFRLDVVLPFMTMLRALAWCRWQGVPALMISDSSLHSGTGRVGRVLKRVLLPTLFRQFRAFLCVCDGNEMYARAYGVPRERIFRVPNVLDEGFWVFPHRHRAERARLRAELGVSEDELLVLYVGKLIPRKRPGDLLAALAQLKSIAAKARPIRVLFAGDGLQSAALATEAAAQQPLARFLGFVNIDTLPGYFCAADVLAHPAEIETFGVITIEAAILGLPLVLSDRVGAIGPTSIARPGENTVVYPWAMSRRFPQRCAGLPTSRKRADKWLRPRCAFRKSSTRGRRCAARWPRSSTV
jgi:hypothetical protein